MRKILSLLIGFFLVALPALADQDLLGDIYIDSVRSAEALATDADGKIIAVAGAIDDHSELNNLDYSSSGHTGFQPAGSYLTSENDPVFSASPSFNITGQDTINIKNLSGINTGDQDLSGYLTSESDPIASAKIGTLTNAKWCNSNGTQVVCNSDAPSSMTYPASGIAVSTGSAWGTSIADNSASWNAAYGWGDHASAGYVTGTPWTSEGYITAEADPIYSASSWATTTNNSSNWDTAYGWGNHATAGYYTLPSFTSGSVLFSNGTGIAEDNTGLFWDATNNRLGIGSNSIPSSFGGANLYVRGSGSSTTTWRGRIVAGGDNRAFLMGEYNSNAWLGAHSADLSSWADLYIQPQGGSDVGIGFDGTTLSGATDLIIGGKVGIGTTTPTSKLDINANDVSGANTLSFTGMPNASNIFLKAVRTGGATGTQMAFSGGAQEYFDILNSTGTRRFRVDSSNGTASIESLNQTGGGFSALNFTTGSWTNATLVNKVIGGSLTINQSGTSGFNVMDWSITQTAVGSGEKNLLRFNRNGSGVFTIDYNGAVAINKSISTSPIAQVDITTLGTYSDTIPSIVAGKAVTSGNSLGASFRNFTGTTGSSFIEIAGLSSGAVKAGHIRTTDTGNMSLHTGSTAYATLGTERLRVEAGGKVLIQQGGTSVLSGVTAVRYTDWNNSGNVGTGEDDLDSLSTAGSTWNQNGDSLEIDTHGTFASNTNNKQIRLRFAGIAIFDTGAVPFNGGNWRIQARIYRTSTTSAKAIITFTSSNSLMSPTQTSWSSSGLNMLGTNIVKTTAEATADNDVVAEAIQIIWNPTS